ncbi:MAG: class I SAM-dependent methyltransferase [Asgard group archaeon]|nr:class I SAM-dependent methyltransferase [Asgard group archaeon]
MIYMTIYDPSKFEIFITKMGNLVMRRYYLKLIEVADLNSNDKVIDFGSGTGYLAKQMTKKLTGNDSWISCVEISEKWNKVARKKLRKFKRADFFTGMITELDMKESYYDKITIHVVLHDIATEYREAIMKSLVKRLKKNGRIIIREPINPSHGIPVDALKEYMKKANMKEISGEVIKHRFLGSTYLGVFEKK